jgi:hypothetical protein
MMKWSKTEKKLATETAVDFSMCGLTVIAVVLMSPSNQPIRQTDEITTCTRALDYNMYSAGL